MIFQQIRLQFSQFPFWSLDLKAAKMIKGFRVKTLQLHLPFCNLEQSVIAILEPFLNIAIFFAIQVWFDFETQCYCNIGALPRHNLLQFKFNTLLLLLERGKNLKRPFLRNTLALYNYSVTTKLRRKNKRQFFVDYKMVIEVSPDCIGSGKSKTQYNSKS